MQNLAHKLSTSWYKQTTWWTYLLLPLALLFSFIVCLRRWLYQKKIKVITKLNVPVIVVGNITVGGTGKTPLVIYLANLLVAHGYRPGIISRGYKGQNKQWQIVSRDSDPLQVGDEAVLLALRTKCPVVIGRQRVAAAKALLANYGCDVILSDDGLQHYALGRDIEIAVVDGARGFGNGFLLPAGPLREPIKRLATVDFIVANGKNVDDAFLMKLSTNKLYNLQQPYLTVDLSELVGKAVHAIAAIGHPQRFFDLLQESGLEVTPHIFPDHYIFKVSDVDFPDEIMVIMTEKDAVKVKPFANKKLWCLPITAELPAKFDNDILVRLTECIQNKQ